jgi:acylphosphatase
VADPVQARWFVAGRVQGVGYRASAAEEGRRLGLRGFARNLADGRVELVARGERAAVEALVLWSRRGPPFARVESLDGPAWEAPAGDLPAFGVAR